MTHLGFLYLRGIAVTQDVAQAFRYFKSAADAVRIRFYIDLEWNFPRRHSRVS